MKRNKKSKLVLFSVLGLAAISIGTVGFATWMVGVQKKEETINVKANVDNTLNDSIYLEAEINQAKPLIIAEKTAKERGENEILGAKEGVTGSGEGYVSVSSEALKFEFNTLQFSVGNGAAKPKQLHLELSAERNDFNKISSTGNKLGSSRSGDSWEYLTLDKTFDIDTAVEASDNTVVTTSPADKTSYTLYTFTNKVFEFEWGSFFGSKSPVAFYNNISTTAADKSASAMFTLADNVSSELVAMDNALKGQTYVVNVSLIA